MVNFLGGLGNNQFISLETKSTLIQT